MKKEFENLLSKDALEDLVRLLKNSNLSTKELNDLRHIEGQLESINRSVKFGVLSSDETMIQRNKVRERILLFLERVERSQAEKISDDRSLYERNKTVIVVCGILLMLGVVILGFYAVFMNVFYLGGYANDVITTENLKKVNHYIQEDSTLRASIFGETIKDLYAISGGRSLYISKYGNEQKERYEEVVVDSFTFSTLAGEFFNKLQSERATYKSLKKESEILENLEERYPDLASFYMAQVDSLCELVQNKIDAQNSMLESLKRTLAMDLRIHEINKKEQYIAIEKKVKYPTSLPGTLFSCTFSGFIVSLDGQDTLIRNLFFKMESSEGIRSHSSEMVHHKYDFYQPIIGLESYQYRFAVTLYDANVDGIDYLFDYEFTPKNLPFNALYLEDVSYVRPVKPTGDCPYLLPFNDHIKRIEERFYQDVLGRLQENGHSFFLGYRKLGKAFVK